MKPFSPEEFRKIYARVPRLCIDLYVESREGVLMTLRSINPAGFWHFPGGTLFFGEAPEQAVKRVAKTELGVESEAGEMIGIINFSVREGIGHAVSLVYRTKLLGDTIKLNNEASEWRYFRKPPENSIVEHADFILKQ